VFHIWVLDRAIKTMDKEEQFQQLEGVTGLIEDICSINKAHMSGTMSLVVSLHCNKLVADNYLGS
jgi:hypothetical protein